MRDKNARVIKTASSTAGAVSFSHSFRRGQRGRGLLALLLCAGMLFNPSAVFLYAGPAQMSSTPAFVKELALAIISKTQKDTVYVDGAEIETWREGGRRLFKAEKGITLRFRRRGAERLMQAAGGVILFEEDRDKEKEKIKLTVYLEGDVLVREGRSEVVNSRLFFKLLNVGVFAVAGIVGVVYLSHGMRVVSAGGEEGDKGRRNLVRLWILIYAFVGSQMAWTLRPFIGAPSIEFELFRRLGGNFYANVFASLGEILGFFTVR